MGGCFSICYSLFLKNKIKNELTKIAFLLRRCLNMDEITQWVIYAGQMLTALKKIRQLRGTLLACLLLKAEQQQIFQRSAAGS